jgi:hypothetical protein
MEITPKTWESTPKLMEITPKTWEIEYIRIKRLDQGREKAYVTATDAICCYYKPFPMYES